MKRGLIFFVVFLSLLLVGCGPLTIADQTPLIDTGVDPEEWAVVPAGEFYYGQHEHETEVDGYEIMVTNVTNEQFAQFLNESIMAESTIVDGGTPMMHYEGDAFHGFRHEEEILEGFYPIIALDDPGARVQLDGSAYATKSGYENHPAVMVTWFGAKAYCDFYGWRLPSEIEWEKAARGTDARPYPWGHGLLSENANYYSSLDIFEKTFGKQGSTTPVGFYNGKTYDGFSTIDSPSPYGLYDMAGNVWQWTADVYEDQHYRYLRGGSKDTYGYNLRVWTRNSAGPEYYSPAAGFRCAR